MSKTDLGPGWQPDPSAAHRFRWYDGNRWSSLVADDDDRVSTDLANRPPGRVRGRLEAWITLLPLVMLAAFIYFGTRR